MRTLSPAPAPLLLVAALLAGCGKSSPGAAPAGSASASPGDSGAAAASDSAAPANSYGAPIGVPFPTEQIVAVINPKHEAPYAGPKGTLRGVIRIDGDPSPDTGLKFQPRCADSAATYGKLFRVGLGKALADTMVAVTGYGDRGFVPARDEAVKIPFHRCVPPKRTYAVTTGQRIEVSNLDRGTGDSYLPYLDGSPNRGVMVAIPQGAPIKLYPGVGPARYMLRDQLPSGLVADVFVVNYATHDVTGLDGQYEIKDIPVGHVRVNVLLPVIDKTEARDLEIKEGDNTLDVTLHFDASKDMPKARPAGSGAAAAGVAPAGAPSAVKPAIKKLP